MSRVIKFRAWHKRLEQISSNTQTISEIYDNESGTNVEDVIWLQYTGLKDKNGIEIYDGDVVTAKTNTHPAENLAGVIIFEDGEYLIEQDDDKFPVCSLSAVDRLTLKAIGNIYENPELLEQTM